MTVWRQKQKLSASQLVTWCYAAVCSGSSCWGQPQLKSALQLAACHISPLSWESIKSCSGLALSQRAPTFREGKALLKPHAVSRQHPACCNVSTSAEAHPG